MTDNLIAQPLTLPCGVTLPNRLLKSAMTEGLADANDNATEAHNRLYQAWSEGGCGTLMTGNIMVDRRYLERPGNVVIDNNGGEDALKAWAKAGTKAGNQLWVQINHPGRQCGRLVSAHPQSPSDVQLNKLGYFGKPQVMSPDDIQMAIGRYIHVAKVSKACGFTGVQVHAAHGYLVSQFHSPVTNKRTDEWGGSLENRARFLLSIVRGIREAVGDDYPVTVKLNSSDFQKGGFSLQESQQVAAWLQELNLDLLEVSGGSYEQPKLVGHTGDLATADEPVRESTRKREAYFMEYAEAIREVFSNPLAVTGGFRSRTAMNEALASGNVDVIGIARPLCVDANIPAGLISGDLDEANGHEKQLRLGNSPFWGPNSSNNTIKSLNTQGAVAWYYRQIIQLANNQPARPNLSVAKALREHYPNEFRLARQRAFKA